MHDGWLKLISNFQPPIKAAPGDSNVRNKRISNSHGFVQQRAKTFFGGTLGETFEAFTIKSDLRLSRRKDQERLLKICNNRLVSLFAERRCNVNLQHDG